MHKLGDQFVMFIQDHLKVQLSCIIYIRNVNKYAHKYYNLYLQLRKYGTSFYRPRSI